MTFAVCVAHAADDHGDNARDATLLPLGQPVAGEIRGTGDYDVFRVDVPGAGTLRFSSVGPTDVEAYLRDGDGRAPRIASDDDSGPGLNFAFEAELERGVVYLVVHGAPGAYAVKAQPADPGDDHGDTPAASSPLTLHSDAAIRHVRPKILLASTGHIGAGGADVDVFRIDVPRDGMRVSVRDAGAIDTDARLLDTTLGEIAVDATVGLPFRIDSQLDEGAYYLEVRAPVAGNYRVLATGDGAACICACPPAPTPADHGGTAETATLLPNGTPMTGVIADASDTDVFRIDLPSTAGLRVVAAAAARTRGELRDETGALVATDYTDGPPGLAFRMSASLSAGVYYLAVTGEPGPFAVRAWAQVYIQQTRLNPWGYDYDDLLLRLSAPLRLFTPDEALRGPRELRSTMGLISTHHDTDMFRIDVREDGTRVTVRGVAEPNRYSREEAGLYGRLLDPPNELLAVDGTNGEFGFEAELDAGVYYVELRGHTESGGVWMSGRPGGYRLVAYGDSRRRCGAPIRPAAPSRLAASAGDGEVRLAWTASPDDGGGAILRHEYRQRSQGGMYGEWIPIPDSAPAGSNATGFRLAGLVNGLTLRFEVRAVSAAGGGLFSNEARATPSRIRVLTPDVLPTGLSGSDRYLDSGAFAVRPIAADLDGDGDLDVLAVHTDDVAYGDYEAANYIAWYENDGGTFAAARLIEELTRVNPAGDPFTVAWSVQVADVVDDGDLDVFANRPLFSGGWYENLGGGDFSSRQSAPFSMAQAFADVDGDGDGDAVVLRAAAFPYGPDESASYDVAWWANEGDAGFAARGWLGGAPQVPLVYVSSALAADFDGDGDPDVVAGYRDAMLWYVNHGGGTFSSPRRIPDSAVGYGAGLHPVDMDGDGDPDLLAEGHLGIAWHENAGDSFNSRTTVTTERATSVRAADLDGDGDMDVVAASVRGVLLYENRGSGFSAGELISAREGIKAVDTADLDADGDPDVLYGPAAGDAVGWIRNVSEREDAPPPATLLAALPAFLHGTLEAPLDRDVYRVATAAGTLRIATNGPTDTFGSLRGADGTILARDDNGGDGTNFAIHAEVGPGDHLIDVRGADGATGAYTLSVSFLAADDHGDSGETATPVADLPWVGWGRLQHEDDRDVFRFEVPESGVIEADAPGATLVLSDTEGRTIASAEGGARLRYEMPAGVLGGTYLVHVLAAGATPHAYELTIGFSLHPSPVAFSPSGGLSTFFGIHLADLDGDGDLDLISGPTWQEYEDAATFLYEDRRRYLVDRSHRVRDVADVDADGDVDALSESAGAIMWLENLGDATFVAWTIASGPEDVYRRGPIAVDLDTDGDVDVMTQVWQERPDGSYDYHGRWHENQGWGMFSEAKPLIHRGGDAPVCGPPPCGWVLGAADLDADGDADLVAEEYDRGQAQLLWYENTDGPPFADQRAIGDRGDPAPHGSVAQAADLDGDGDLDLVAATASGAAWHENLGGGVFSPHRELAQRMAGEAITVAAADLDGDRDLDIVASRRIEDVYPTAKLVWHENLGGGAFSSERVIAEGPYAADADPARAGIHYVVRPADVDGDGDADMVGQYSDGYYDLIASWHENQANHGDDHGDTAAQATLAPVLPAALYGVLESQEDRDVFRFVTGDGDLRVSSSGHTDTLGAVLDHDGRELAADDDSGDNANFAITVPVVRGTHYVVVSGAGAATGRYALSVVSVPTASP
ncbi:MAG: FG-GAP-like repeat-containing protein [Gammaproteobacteria bacterium]|nr:FG-GAP-like repeat-containing protein [Gammaproteobacteria bacterium]